MSYTITKEFRFEAAHHLPQMPDGHQCKRPHGHSYKVIVELRSNELDEYGFVQDFGELDVVKRWIDDTLDHRNLNEILGGRNTTAERIAEALFYEFRDQLGIKLLSAVAVCETDKTKATYRPPMLGDIGHLRAEINRRRASGPPTEAG